MRVFVILWGDMIFLSISSSTCYVLGKVRIHIKSVWMHIINLIVRDMEVTNMITISNWNKHEQWCEMMCVGHTKLFLFFSKCSTLEPVAGMVNNKHVNHIISFCSFPAEYFWVMLGWFWCSCQDLVCASLMGKLSWSVKQREEQEVFVRWYFTVWSAALDCVHSDTQPHPPAGLHWWWRWSEPQSQSHWNALGCLNACCHYSKLKL